MITLYKSPTCWKFKVSVEKAMQCRMYVKRYGQIILKRIIEFPPAQPPPFPWAHFFFIQQNFENIAKTYDAEEILWIKQIFDCWAHLRQNWNLHWMIPLLQNKTWYINNFHFFSKLWISSENLQHSQLLVQ